MVAKLAINVTL